MSALRQAAQQALEALLAADAVNSYQERMQLNAILNLRAALAEPEPAIGTPQAEPGSLQAPQEPCNIAPDVARRMSEAGMTLHLGMPHKAVMEQMTRFHDLVCAEASIKAAKVFADALRRKPLSEGEILARASAFLPLKEMKNAVDFARAIERAVYGEQNG